MVEAIASGAMRPLSLRLLELGGGLAGLMGLGLLGLLPIGGSPVAGGGAALLLATLPIAGGLALSGVSLVVLVEQQGHADSGLKVMEALCDATVAAGRLALAAVPVLLVFASTSEHLLFQSMLYATIGVVGLFAVCGVAIRLVAQLGAKLQLHVLSWAILGFAVICTLLARVG